ncbi:MAG: sulfite exporter TauE/SafE family protein [Candidatus Omnitrophica bacterium]|nr:sulfite exporter TauE/SafE family protein [Candidatus Omnitrophota bacterium]
MIIVVALLAFVSEFLDSGLGMGYGTALAPLMIILGYDPLKVVPAILISQLCTDIAACVCHHNLSNVDLRVNSKDFKVALLLGMVSSVGVIISVLIAVRIPKWILTAYIGVLVLSMGVLILITMKKPLRFSWRRLAGISLLASFNKGISGGGYGPLVMGGQLLAGVNSKNAVGITAFAEAITCFVGFMIYLISGKFLDWKLIGILVLSATLAVPFAAWTVKNIFPQRLKFYVGILIILLGLMTLLKISSGS